MKFQDKLNEYIRLVGCSGRELAQASGLSPATISRYRSGTRVPGAGAWQLNALAQGVALLARLRGVHMDAAGVERALTECLAPPQDSENLRANLNELLATLPVSATELSRALSYAPSYLSRIRSGARRPSDPARFAQETARFVVRRCTGEAERRAVARLAGARRARGRRDHDARAGRLAAARSRPRRGVGAGAAAPAVRLGVGAV